MIEKYSYRVTWSGEDGEYVGLCAEFPRLSWLHKSQDLAFKGIKKLVVDVVGDMKEQGEEIPEPLSTKHFSGKLMLRVPPELHRELAVEAHEANISLNRYISTKLAARSPAVPMAPSRRGRG
jgi:predicted HicB family RNase H-like nuclease